MEMKIDIDVDEIVQEVARGAMEDLERDDLFREMVARCSGISEIEERLERLEAAVQGLEAAVLGLDERLGGDDRLLESLVKALTSMRYRAHKGQG
tara:strand:- start:1813 stop:2097 length:285 start_codon:yes stop_codon:yes gene_type:complete